MKKAEDTHVRREEGGAGVGTLPAHQPLAPQSKAEEGVGAERKEEGGN